MPERFARDLSSRDMIISNGDWFKCLSVIYEIPAALWRVQRHARGEACSKVPCGLHGQA